MNLPSEVVITEVVTRDGLQNEHTVIPTVEKINLINRLSRAGLQSIEVTSFVNPRSVPQLADAEAVLAGIERHAGVTYSAITPNVRGIERAIRAGVGRINFFLSVSESHNQANVKMTVAESLSGFALMADLARENHLAVNGSMATTFGCPYEGEVPYARVSEVIDRLVGMGITDITLADTAGTANPEQVYEVCSRVRAQWPQVRFALHLHDRFGQGLANVLSAMQAGMAHFDAALGGIGGCPFMPGASGNICTEDLVQMLHSAGVPTGIDLDLLVKSARCLQDKILQRELSGKVIKSYTGCGM